MTSTTIGYPLHVLIEMFVVCPKHIEAFLVVSPNVVSLKFRDAASDCDA